MAQSFQEVLQAAQEALRQSENELLRDENIYGNGATNAFFTSGIEPSSLNFEKVRRAPPTRHPYPRSAKKAKPEEPKVTTAPPVVEETRLKVAELTAHQQADLRELFRLKDQALPETLSYREFKKVYRQLARRHHPDVAPGQAKVFIAIQERYKRLQGIFKD